MASSFDAKRFPPSQVFMLVNKQNSLTYKLKGKISLYQYLQNYLTLFTSKQKLNDAPGWTFWSFPKIGWRWQPS